MARPAKEARDRAQASWPGAVVVSRTRTGIKHRHPADPRRFMLDVGIGPMHFGPSEDQEIDTAWQPGIAPWDFQMVQAGYNALALSNFSSGQIVKYVHPGTGESIAFQPQQLQYTNDLNQIQAIADPQSVSAVVQDEDVLIWQGAFGTGFDIRWQAQTARLDKRLVVDQASRFPAPQQFIIDGGNPVLRLQFIFAPSNNLDIFVNGVLWNRQPNSIRDTQAYVEFRQQGTGEVLWSFNLPRSNAAPVEDQDPDELLGTFRLRRTGPNLLVEHRIPIAWLQTAAYPIEIDVTIDEQIGGSSDDVTENQSGDVDGLGNLTLDHVNEWWGGRFQTVDVPNAATIDVAYLSVVPVGTTADEPKHDFDFVAEDSSSAWSAGSATFDVSGRTRTGNAVLWDVADLGADGSTFFNTPSLVTACQAVVDRAGWSANNTMAVTCHQPTTAGTRDLWIKDYVNDSTQAAKLHIEYTAGSGQTIAVAQVTEADASQAVGKLKTKLAGQVLEADLSQTMARLKTAAIGQISEADLAQALAAAKAKAIGQIAETDLAQAVTENPKHRLIAQVFEADLAQTITAPIVVVVAQAAELDLSQGMAWAPKHRLVGLILEIDLSQAITSAKVTAIGQIIESDLAQGVTSGKARALGQISEIDLAQLFGRAKTALIAAVLEAELAQAVSSGKARALGQSIELEIGQAVTSLKRALINQVFQTDLAQTVAWAPKHRLIRQALETDLAQVISAAGELIVAVNQVLETDLAQLTAWAPKHRLIELIAETDFVQALTTAKAAGLGQATESDLGQALASAKARALGQALEADLAQALGRLKSALVAAAIEADLAQAVSSLKRLLIGQALETDLAQIVTLTGELIVAVNQVLETDLAQLMAWAPKHRLIAQAAELDAGFGIASLKLRALGQASEADLAQALSSLKARLLGQSSEADLAQALASAKRLAIAAVLETDLAQLIGRSKARLLAQVSEQELAQAIVWSPKARLIQRALEADLAQALLWAPKHRLVGQVSELDLAQAMTLIGALLATMRIAHALVYGLSIDHASIDKLRIAHELVEQLRVKGDGSSQ
jgi:hypothetical protein